MISFLLRKNFYNCWDAASKLFGLNLILFLMLFGIVSAAAACTQNAAVPEWTGTAVCAAGIILISIYVLAVSMGMAQIADYKKFPFKALFGFIADVWKEGVFLGLCVCAWFVVVTKVIPWYMALDSTAGLILAAVVFWCALVAVLSLQWYIPLRSQLPRTIKKTLKKCLLLFFDNPGFSCFLLIYNAVCLVLSVFLLTLIPGVAGVVLNLNNALRLRLYKYDWIEDNEKNNPSFDIRTDRKNVPWDKLLEEDEEATGYRTLKNLFLPWK